MNRELLPPEERASRIEKIILLTSEINHAAVAVNEISSDYKRITKKPLPTAVLDEVVNQGINSHERTLDELIADLFTARERLMEYMNSIDAVTETDIKLSKIVFDTVQDLKPEDEA